MPADIADHTLHGADVDGDGDIDTVHTYSQGAGEAKAWTLQVSFTGGGGTAVPLDYPDIAFADVRGYDGVDINQDGTEEIFVKTGGGDHVRSYAVYVVIDCDLAVTTSPEPSPLNLIEGAEPGESGPVSFIGFECGANWFDETEHGLFTYVANHLGDDVWEVTARFYALIGTEFVFQWADPGGGEGGSAYQGPMCPGITPW